MKQKHLERAVEIQKEVNNILVAEVLLGEEKTDIHIRIFRLGAVDASMIPIPASYARRDLANALWEKVKEARDLGLKLQVEDEAKTIVPWDPMKPDGRWRAFNRFGEVVGAQLYESREAAQTAHPYAKASNI